MDEPAAGTAQPLFYSTGDFAVLTRLSVATVQRMCGRGLIAHIVVSDRGDRRIPASEVERLLAEAEGARSSQVGA
ncbi:MAG: helix-turn-helix domain-containing protein [bacterium]|nr:helix-turn-helix domain-containing protein [bacterium]